MLHFYLVHLYKGNSYVRTAPFIFEDEKAAHVFCLGVKKENTCIIERVAVVSADMVKKAMYQLTTL